jgi:hypothetical protein
MNQTDPLLYTVVRRLTMARSKPPTVARILLSWSSWPLLAVLGTFSVLLLSALDIPPFVPVLMAGFYLGVALRDLGFSIKLVRFWPIQKELYDWPKIEALARGMELPDQWNAASPTRPE